MAWRVYNHCLNWKVLNLFGEFFMFSNKFYKFRGSQCLTQVKLHLQAQKKHYSWLPGSSFRFFEKAFFFFPSQNEDASAPDLGCIKKPIFVAIDKESFFKSLNYLPWWQKNKGNEKSIILFQQSAIHLALHGQSQHFPYVSLTPTLYVH